jgi:hypothetical protein
VIEEYRVLNHTEGLHKPVVKMTKQAPYNHSLTRGKNITDCIRSRKTNTFLSLRIQRQMDLSALQVSTTSNTKALFVQGSL